MSILRSRRTSLTRLLKRATEGHGRPGASSVPKQECIKNYCEYGFLGTTACDGSEETVRDLSEKERDSNLGLEIASD